MLVTTVTFTKHIFEDLLLSIITTDMDEWKKTFTFEIDISLSVVGPDEIWDGDEPPS